MSDLVGWDCLRFLRFRCSQSSSLAMGPSKCCCNTIEDPVRIQLMLRTFRSTGRRHTLKRVRQRDPPSAGQPRDWPGSKAWPGMIPRGRLAPGLTMQTGSEGGACGSRRCRSYKVQPLRARTRPWTPSHPSCLASQGTARYRNALHPCVYVHALAPSQGDVREVFSAAGRRKGWVRSAAGSVRGPTNGAPGSTRSATHLGERAEARGSAGAQRPRIREGRGGGGMGALQGAAGPGVRAGFG